MARFSNLSMSSDSTTPQVPMQAAAPESIPRAMSCNPLDNDGSVDPVDSPEVVAAWMEALERRLGKEKVNEIVAEGVNLLPGKEAAAALDETLVNLKKSQNMLERTETAARKVDEDRKRVADALQKLVDEKVAFSKERATLEREKKILAANQARAVSPLIYHEVEITMVPFSAEENLKQPTAEGMKASFSFISAVPVMARDYQPGYTPETIVYNTINSKLNGLFTDHSPVMWVACAKRPVGETCPVVFSAITPYMSSLPREKEGELECRGITPLIVFYLKDVKLWPKFRDACISNGIWTARDGPVELPQNLLKTTRDVFKSLQAAVTASAKKNGLDSFSAEVGTQPAVEEDEKNQEQQQQ